MSSIKPHRAGAAFILRFKNLRIATITTIKIKASKNDKKYHQYYKVPYTMFPIDQTFSSPLQPKFLKNLYIWKEITIKIVLYKEK